MARTKSAARGKAVDDDLSSSPTTRSSINAKVAQVDAKRETEKFAKPRAKKIASDKKTDKTSNSENDLKKKRINQMETDQKSGLENGMKSGHKGEKLVSSEKRKVSISDYSESSNDVDERQEASEDEDEDGKDEEDEEEDCDLMGLDIPLLPGVLSLTENTAVAVRGMLVCALASSVMSFMGRLLVGWVSSMTTPAWLPWIVYLGTLSSPGVLASTAFLGLNLLKLGLAWGNVSNLIALDVLTLMPFVYLHSSFYNVSLSTVLLCVSIDLVADVLPLLLWKLFFLEAALEEAGMAGEEVDDLFVEELMSESAFLQDPLTYVLSTVFSTLLCGFTLVQAARFVLPVALVVHFKGIYDIRPIYAKDLVDLPSLSSLLSAGSLLEFGSLLFEFSSLLFLGGPAFLVNVACGIAARNYIFSETDVPPAGSSFYGKVVRARTLAAFVAVCICVFTQCYLSLQENDAVGSAIYALVWGTAPVLVGASLGYVGV